MHTDPIERTHTVRDAIGQANARLVDLFRTGRVDANGNIRPPADQQTDDQPPAPAAA